MLKSNLEITKGSGAIDKYPSHVFYFQNPPNIVDHSQEREREMFREGARERRVGTGRQRGEVHEIGPGINIHDTSLSSLFSLSLSLLSLSLYLISLSLLSPSLSSLSSLPLSARRSAVVGIYLASSACGLSFHP